MSFFKFVKKPNAMNTVTINSSLRPQREALLQHSLYGKIKTIDDLKHFLEGHVYAVWDFMSLLKALQAKLTCTATPWLPVGNPETRYLINEIVLTKETDLDADGKRQSLFEMYLNAMKACGADTAEVEAFLDDVVTTQNIFVSIRKSSLHDDIKGFLDFTFRVIDQGAPHEIAAALAFGRGQVIPSSFTGILKALGNNFPEARLEKLIYYFEHQIAIDINEHSPMSMKMVEELCGNDTAKWKDAEEIAIMALEKRMNFWNAIEENMLHHDMASL